MVRQDWLKNEKHRRFIFEYLVLRLLWCILLALHKKEFSSREAHYEKGAILDYIETFGINPESTAEIREKSFPNF